MSRVDACGDSKRQRTPAYRLPLKRTSIEFSARFSINRGEGAPVQASTCRETMAMSASAVGDLMGRLESHAQFFDNKLALIPPKAYWAGEVRCEAR